MVPAVVGRPTAEQGSGGAMQRREYLTLFISSTRWSDSLGREGTLRSIPGRFSRPTGDPTGILNELGEQGWEQAGVAGGDENYVCRLFLKHPRT